MRSRHLVSTILLFAILLLSNCYWFESIQQPQTVQPNSIFDIEVTVGINYETWEDTLSDQSYYSICLPESWTTADSIPFTGEINGTYHYSQILSDTLTLNADVEHGYRWRTYVTDVVIVDSLVGEISFTQTVQTNSEIGLYFIDYRLGHGGDPSYWEQYMDEEPHLLWVGIDPTPIIGDVYVSPEGSDANGGLSSSDPLKTITSAILRLEADSLNHRRIHLAEGEYKRSSSGEYYPLFLPDYVSLEGTASGMTILDAEGLHIAIVLDSVEVDSITGITITGGSCCEFTGHGSWGSTYHYGGGGLYMVYSDLVLSNVIIQNNSSDIGGGIFTEESNLTLNNVLIQENQSDHGGGGISFGECGEDVNYTLDMEDCQIIDNETGYSGGGICLTGRGVFRNVLMTGNVAQSRGGALEVNWNQGNGSTALLADVTITNNTADWGGGLFAHSDCSIQFDPVDLCNIHGNRADMGGDVGVGHGSPTMNVIVDTFTVMHPTDYHATPRHRFSFTIQNGLLPQVDQDLYISPLGSNDNTGTSPEDPLRTIAYANAVIRDDRTIHLGEGVYSPSSTGEIFPISMVHGTNLLGANMANVILDSEDQGPTISLYQDNVSLDKVTITGGGMGIDVGYGSVLSADSIIITENTNTGMRVESDTRVNVYNSKITNNSGGHGGGVLNFGRLQLINVLVSGNYASNGGGGMWVVGRESSVVMNHVTMVNNHSANTGGGIENLAVVQMTSSILRDNQPDQYHENDFDGQISFAFSNIQNGEGDIVYEDGTVEWRPGNIDEDPLFCNSWEGDYHLAEGSPSLGTGQYGTNMGAYGLGCTETVDLSDETNGPQDFALYQNYPNPFNPATIIRYSLPETAEVKLVVFDVLGREIITLAHGEQAEGFHEVPWQGVNVAGHKLSTGVYFACLTAGGYTHTIKMLYLE